MKTKLLSIAIGALSLFSMRSNAQSYTFSQLTSPYADVTGGTVVTTSGWDDFTIIDTHLPFTFNFFGNVEDSLYILSGFAAFHEVGAGNFPIDQIYYFDAELVERSTGTSNISTVTVGSSPNRIYKVQTKNAGYGNDGGGTESANVQLWLYETSNVVEIHYGASNGSAATYNPLTGPTVGIYKDQTAFVALSGSASNPSASSSAASLNVNGNPPSGMVYRFAPGAAAGIKESGHNSAGMIYPNPSNGTINFRSSSDITNGSLKVINAIGQLVYEKNDFTISKNQTQKLDLSLETGLYYLQISSKGQNFSPEKLIVK
ncbi:MAG: T9SS type A sorting domain-containing protein [Bacteroidia bacterium]